MASLSKIKAKHHGSCYGSGDGSGYGDGSGDGSGYGYGSGDGDGYGSNFGVAAFCGDAVRRVDDVSTILYHIHGNIAKGAILNKDLTTTPCYIVKSGNLFAHGETLRKAQEALEAKVMENMPVEERIDKFIAEFKPGQKYPARDFWNWHHALTGSCEMGRNEFARDHGIDLENDALTPEEFIKLTENAYGREVIRQLKERFSNG